MLWDASAINGYAIAASDGRLGTVSDFLFDDASWLVRWLVVDTGNWLSGRKILLPPSALGHLDPKGREFAVGLTMRQVKDSPDIDTERPVSRQLEANIYDYYGWQPYWGTGLLMGGFDYGDGARAVSTVPESRRLEEDIAAAQRSNDDPHLRSIEAVTGYHIHASDGEIETGYVELADGSRHAYGALLLATGAEPVRLEVPGGDLQHVHYLRTLADSRALVSKALASRRAVVIGASFIGLEVAASLRARKIEVHVVGPETIPMEKVLGPEVGNFLRRLHEEHGVTFHLGTTATSIDERSVTLKNGEKLQADLVVVGIGVRPAISLAELTRQVAHLFDAPMRDRIQRGRAESLTGAQTEAGMMPWASNRIAHEKALFERSTVMRADGTDREQFIAAPDKEHRFAERVPEQHGSVRNR